MGYGDRGGSVDENGIEQTRTERKKRNTFAMIGELQRRVE